jgi:hypothetical protein
MSGPPSEGLVISGDGYTYESPFLSKNAIFPGKAVVLGPCAGHYGGTLGASVLIGAYAGRAALAEFVDFVSIGAHTHPLASRTVSFGNTDDIVTSPKGLVTRADKRDFTDYKDLPLGLDFILKLKPQLATMDLREDYVDHAGMPLPPDDCPLPPESPNVDDRNPVHRKTWMDYLAAMTTWQETIDKPYRAALNIWRGEYRAWQVANNLTDIQSDGSRKHTEAQAILLADDVAEAAASLKQSFTGMVDFKHLKGLDVKGMRLEEMVPVLVKGMQELHEYIHSDIFIEQVATVVVSKARRQRDALRAPAPEKE